MSTSFEMDSPSRVTVGTQGRPGQRTFYLQAQDGDVTMSLKMEKQQVEALGQLLDQMLADLPGPPDIPDNYELELTEPVVAAWAVGGIQLSYDSDAERVVLLFEEAVEDEGAVGRLSITPVQARAIALHATSLVESGRPPCPLCGRPMDPSGHACPRTNGHRPRTA